MATDILKEQEIETDITAEYTYVLCVKSPPRGMIYDEKNNKRPDPEYPRQKNLLLRSSIIWPGGKDPFTQKDRAKGRYPIRYYDGCTSLFIDDQPKDKEVIEQLVRSTQTPFFINGYFRVQGYDTMLKTYVDWASWNELSKFKVPSINPIYKLLDAEAERKELGATIDQVELALQYAKKADDKKMMIHAHFIDVPTIDPKTGRELSPASIRAEYRKAAMNNTKKFLETYDDKSLATRFWIEKGIERGDISTTLVPNKAVWAKTGVLICDISGLASPEFIMIRLVEFSQSEEGKKFEEKLKVLYS